MKKKLPKVFANKIEKVLNNNAEIYNSSHCEKQAQTQTEQIDKPSKILINTESKTINQKINEIINSKKYIYKVPVKIKTDTEEIKTKIIGRNKNNIITIDNTLIKIETIKNIEIYEQ